MISVRSKPFLLKQDARPECSCGFEVFLYKMDIFLKMDVDLNKENLWNVEVNLKAANCMSIK